MRVSSLASLLIALAGQGSALACSCAARSGESWESDAAVIFLARILSSEVTEEKSNIGLPVVKARFEVVEQFRGDAGAIPYLRTTAGGSLGTCGIPYTAGDQFLVFTSPQGNTGQCGGTHIFHSNVHKHVVEKLRQLRASAKAEKP